MVRLGLLSQKAVGEVRRERAEVSGGSAIQLIFSPSSFIETQSCFSLRTYNLLRERRLQMPADDEENGAQINVSAELEKKEEQVSEGGRFCTGSDLFGRE